MTTGTSSIRSIALPAILLVALSGGVASQIKSLTFAARDSSVESSPTISVLPHEFSYRQDGEFYRNGFAVDAPLLKVEGKGIPLTIMKYQVSEADYERCVEARRCKPADYSAPARGNFPATGMSFDDATAYAAWLSEATGQQWRLPTDREMAMAAGEKFPDDALGVDTDTTNPAIRWLADYDRETRRKPMDARPQPAGSFGEAESGLADFAGNIWEWTSTCHRRVELGGNAGATKQDVACGVYVTVGRHRSPMSSFVREPKSGGCAVGTPPANLGFRLVRDEPWLARLRRHLPDWI